MSQMKISAIKSLRYNQSRLSHLKEGKAVLILRTIPCNSRHNTARSPDRFSGTGHGISPAALTSFVFPILGVLESLLRPLIKSLFYLTSLESVPMLFKKEMGNLARLPTCNNRPGHEIPDTPLSVSSVVNALKTVSSRLIRSKYPNILHGGKTGLFWSRSYFAASAGGVTIDILKKYVEQQSVK